MSSPRRPARVLHVMNSAGGGAALSTLGLIAELGRRGVASSVACHDAGSPEEREAVRDAVAGAATFLRLYWWNRKIRSPAWKRPLIELKQGVLTGWARGSAAAVARFAQQQGVDLIHTNTLTTPEGGYAARRLGLPHVWHVRELVGPGRPFRLPVEGRRLGRRLARLASVVVANSEAAAAPLRDWLGPGLLRIVANGIDLGAFAPRPPAPAGTRLVAAMVGNLTSRWKKHALFVEAAARVDPGLPLEFRIYGRDPSDGGRRPGDGYAHNLHRRIRAAGLEGRFRVVGFVADPARIMREVDILVHPADQESFGRVVVEAMASGLPVAGVRGGGVGAIVEHGVTGLLAEPDDPTGLARAIEGLIDPEVRARLGAAGRARAERLYSLAACAEGILDVYAAALDRPLRRG